MTKTKNENGNKTENLSNGSENNKAWTQLEKQLYPHLDKLLKGHTLAIDPSSGSYSSQPGYSLFHQGQLEDSGIIQIHSGDHISSRLFRLANALRNDFDPPDILIIENIPPFMAQKGSNPFSTRNVVSLHQSVGVMMSIWDCPVAFVSPKTWRYLIPAEYKKDDENDAIMIGYTAILKAKVLAEVEVEDMSPHLIHKLTTGIWPTEKGQDNE